MNNGFDYPFDSSRPVEMIRKLYYLWMANETYAHWWRKIVDAYDVNDSIKLLEWCLHDRIANLTQDDQVREAVTNFLRDVDEIKVGKSQR